MAVIGMASRRAVGFALAGHLRTKLPSRRITATMKLRGSAKNALGLAGGGRVIKLSG